jgi:hypothetical protein
VRILRVDEAFEHDLGARRHLQRIDARREARRKFGTGTAQQSRELVLGERVRHGRHRAQDGGRVCAEYDRDGIWLARVAQRELTKVQRAAAVREPSHDELVASDQLLPVDAQILPHLVRPARDGEPPRDERPCVAGPAGLDR